MTPVGVQFRGDPVRPVVALTGEVDASNAEDLGERIANAVGNEAVTLVLDLSGVTYLDSSGIRLVFRLSRGLRNRQQDLHLVIPSSSRVRRPLDLAGVGAVALVVPDAAALSQITVEGA